MHCNVEELEFECLTYEATKSNCQSFKYERFTLKAYKDGKWEIFKESMYREFLREV